MNMKTITSLALFASCAISMAQVAPLPLYAAARSIKDQNISLEGWGSGTISETDGIAYQGTKSVRVSSRNYFQGGSILLGAPVDLAKKYDDKTNLLTFTFFLEDAGWVYGVNDKGQDTSGSSGLKSKGGGAAQLKAGTKTSTFVNDAPAPFKPKIAAFRLIITTTDNKKSEVYVPVGTSQSALDVRGWRNVSIPLQAINGFDRTNKVVKEISVSTDTFATVYVGQLAVTTDQTPITGEVQDIDSLNLALGDSRTFIARGEGGSSVLIYDWDFDATDGIQVDSEGQVVSHKFRTPGTFKVTLTISDLYGLKKPYVTTFNVKVNP
jgi:hypothetical protein